MEVSVGKRRMEKEFDRTHYPRPAAREKGDSKAAFRKICPYLSFSIRCHLPWKNDRIPLSQTPAILPAPSPPFFPFLLFVLFFPLLFLFLLCSLLVFLFLLLLLLLLSPLNSDLRNLWRIWNDSPHFTNMTPVIRQIAFSTESRIPVRVNAGFQEILMSTSLTFCRIPLLYLILLLSYFPAPALRPILYLPSPPPLKTG